MMNKIFNNNHKMDRETLKEKLRFYIIQGEGLSGEVRDLLMEFRNLGGHQADAEEIVKEIKQESAEELQNNTDDVLDIITGWCTAEMRVWNDE
ncbi:hypothetical protein M2T82_01885 [Elizabethkingia ursingii]|uniref:hypothetical protein n=1 Tax=Elizabethkingia ursingii TaxID=1756150 RepID=UPI0020112D49|nr:hypothetical protein [Elizabethkingia ursingii]MCL1666805.1 hypothetical protein [Elizabethkingia ursingii]